MIVSKEGDLEMKRWRRLLASTLAATVLSGLVSVPAMAEEGNAGEQYTKNGNYYYEPLEQGNNTLGGYTLEKVSHPDRGSGELDSILDPEERSQSYSWSMAEYGDYVYIGTCYNSTYYIYHNNVLTALKGMQKSGTISADVDVNSVAEDIVEVAFGVDAFDKTQIADWKPVIMAVNKHTGEAEVIFREREIWDDYPDIFPGYGIAGAPKNFLSGYRMAFEFHDKIYFAGMGNPTATLVEVDPATNATQIVYHNINRTQGVSNGVHGLLVYDDEILMCLATDNYDGKGTPGGIIVGSKDPSKGLDQWRVIADQDDFDGLPAVMQIDGLNGGGIWDIIEFNGDLYVTVVTDKTDAATGETNKQGFALYRGDKQADESFVWTQLAGDKEESKLPFGFGIDYSMACNMWVYDNHLYLGTYNDPMLDLATVPASGNFEPLYRDLDHSIYLYRMDTDGNFEMVAGNNDNPCFPNGPIGNLGAGLGNHSNQYVWRYGVHQDELYIGTYDTSTLTYMFTQLTDGQVKDMSEEDIAGRSEKLKDALLKILQQQDNPVLQKFLDKTIFSGTSAKLFQALSSIASELSTDWNPVPDYEKNIANYEVIKQLVLDRIQMLNTYAMNDSENELPEAADVDDLLSIMSDVADENGQDDIYLSVDDFMESLSDEEVELLYISATVDEETLDNVMNFSEEETLEEEALAEEEEETLAEEQNPAEEEIPVDDVSSVEPTTAFALRDQVPSQADMNEMKEQLKAILIEALEVMFDELDELYYDDMLHNFIYYYGVNYYAQHCERGFDLLVSKDGVNFDAITRDGFGDAKNHGLRTICSTDQGVYMGTANPFQGTQLWRMYSERDLKLDTDETAERYKIKITIDGKGSASASQDTAVEGKYVTLTATPDEGYVFEKWEAVTPSDLEIRNNQFRMPGEDVEIKACFVKKSSDQNPSEGEKPSGDQKPSEGEKPSGDQKPSEGEKPSGDQKPESIETISKAPSTGDHNNVRIFIYTALIAVAALSVVLVFKLKKHYKF